MTIVWVITLIAFVPLILVDAVFLIEISFGLIKPARLTTLPQRRTPSIAIVMPAHNEAETLESACDMLCRLVAGGTRIVVVADNCTDDTAATAAAAGCEIVVRTDPRLRGKGYALEAGREHLKNCPPDVIIVLDADCSIDDDSLALLASRALICNCAVQAAYLFRNNPLALPRIHISNFAFAVKNLIRQRGSRRIGAAAILVGSGMAFPWQLFQTLDLATGNVVEDLVLGISLVRQQAAPMFEEAATVWSDASNSAGTEKQRARWEGGFLQTAWQFSKPLIFEGIICRDFKRFWLGAHLLVPAFAILVLLNLVALMICAAIALMTSALLPALYAAIPLLLVGLAVILAWIVEGRRHMPARALLQIPLYLAWKIAMYARLVSGRLQVEWTRTERVQKD